MKTYIRLLLTLLLLSVLSLSALTAGATGHADVQSIDSVTDLADLLTEKEEDALRVRIDTLRNTYQFDIAILTVESLNGKSPGDYAYDYYTYNGFGVGENHDGLVFLQSTGERDFYTCAKGYGEVAFTPYGIDQMTQYFVPYLSEGAYFQAYNSYLDVVDHYLKLAAEGTPVKEPYVTGETPSTEGMDIGERPSADEPPMDSMTFWLISFVVSAILAFFIVLAMKKSMNTAVRQSDASGYIKRGSFQLSDQRDIYLYTTTTATPRPKQNDSNSGGFTGSGTFTGSDGGSYSGGGGKY